MHRESTSLDVGDNGGGSREEAPGSEVPAEGECPSRRGFLIRSTATAATASGMLLWGATDSQAGGHLNPKVDRRKKHAPKPIRGGGGGGGGTIVGGGGGSVDEVNAERRTGGGSNLPRRLIAQDREYFLQIQKHENDHAAFLFKALSGLGKAFPATPDFFINLEQPSVWNFVTVAYVFENVGVGAYLGALPLLSGSSYLADAGSIALIEARHAGFLNTLYGAVLTESPVIQKGDQSFEIPLSPDQVFALITPYLSNPAAVKSMLFPVNDAVSALRFALALEYLESTFYNVNVPKFARQF